MNEDTSISLNIAGQSPWNNFIRTFDVNNNGETTVSDALQIINKLSWGAYADLADGYLKSPEELSEWPGIYYDINGDERVTVLDALLVINELARTPMARVN